MAKRKEMYLKTVGGSFGQISSNAFTFKNKIPKFIHDKSCCGQILYVSQTVNHCLRLQEKPLKRT